LVELNIRKICLTLHKRTSLGADGTGVVLLGLRLGHIAKKWVAFESPVDASQARVVFRRA
jgi:hypothetical protein